MPNSATFSLVDGCAAAAGILTGQPSYGLGWRAITLHVLETQFDSNELKWQPNEHYLTLIRHLDHFNEVKERTKHSDFDSFDCSCYPVSLLFDSLKETSIS